MAPGSGDATMTLPLGRWPARRIGGLWGAGLLLEGALLLVAAVLFVRPEPPLVARLRGARDVGPTAIFSADTLRFGGPRPRQLPAQISPTPHDSIYTILHWPLTKPLLAGGGRVLTLPMWMWWVPVLYVALVPLVLLGLTGAWLWGRGQPPSSLGPPSRGSH